MSTLLSPGRPYTLVQNEIYALPAKRSLVRAQPITNIQVSNDNTTYATPVADAQGQFETAAVFIRDSVGGAIVTVKT